MKHANKIARAVIALIFPVLLAIAVLETQAPAAVTDGDQVTTQSDSHSLPLAAILVAAAATALAPSTKRLLVHQNRRGAIIKAMDELLEHDADQWSDEQQADYDGFEAELKQTDAAIAREEKLAALVATEPADPSHAPREPNASDWKIPATARRTRNLRAFTGTDAERNAYAAGMYFLAITEAREDSPAAGAIAHARQWCRDNGYLQPRADAHTIDDNTKGGYTVPTPVTSAVVDVRDLAGVARRVCRVIPISSNATNVPKRTGGLTVDYPGEATAASTSEKTWGQIALACVKRTVITKVSRELSLDAVIMTADDIASEIGQALAEAEDNEFINGDGTSTYGSETGILSAVGAAGVVTLGSGDTAYTNVAMADINGLVALLPEKHHAGAGFVCSRAFYAAALEGLILALGGSTTQDAADGPNRRRFLGYPVDFTSKMPSTAAVSQKCLAFGNFRNGVVLGDRGDFTVASSEHFAFDEDVTTVRGSTRYDLNVHDGGDGSNAGAYVVLKLAAS